MRTLALAAMFILAGCGDKVPQSEAAKKIGDIPKQTIDAAKSGVSKAMEQGSVRLEEQKE
jgi:predicted small lipoprotein YifL